jgi:hypothetical protein
MSARVVQEAAFRVVLRLVGSGPAMGLALRLPALVTEEALRSQLEPEVD